MYSFRFLVGSLRRPLEKCWASNNYHVQSTILFRVVMDRDRKRDHHQKRKRSRSRGKDKGARGIRNFPSSEDSSEEVEIVGEVWRVNNKKIRMTEEENSRIMDNCAAVGIGNNFRNPEVKAKSPSSANNWRQKESGQTNHYSSTNQNREMKKTPHEPVSMHYGTATSSSLTDPTVFGNEAVTENNNVHTTYTHTHYLYQHGAQQSPSIPMANERGFYQNPSSTTTTYPYQAQAASSTSSSMMLGQFYYPLRSPNLFQVQQTRQYFHSSHYFGGPQISPSGMPFFDPNSRNHPWANFQQGSSAQIPVRFASNQPVKPKPSKIVVREVFGREWELVSRDATKIQPSGCVRFSVMCYNILAPTLQETHKELYVGCNPRFSNWEYRQKCFFKEMEQYTPGIICLQEVEGTFLKEYDDFFHTLGYQGVFKERTGDKADGCAIYFAKNKFRLIDSVLLEYFQPGHKVLNRDNVAVIVLLETISQSQPQRLVIGTTHLLFNPKRTDVKLAQADLLLSQLKKMAYCGEDAQGSSLYLPTIVTGDLNSHPTHPVTEHFLKSGKDLKKDNQDANNPNHVFNFRDVYGFPCGTDENEHLDFVTTHQNKWVRVDYIFYSLENPHNQEGSLKLQRRLKLLTQKQCSFLGKIPRQGISSDHFPLMAEFLLVPNKKQS